MHSYLEVVITCWGYFQWHLDSFVFYNVCGLLLRSGNVLIF